jgi:hypothetical protein
VAKGGGCAGGSREGRHVEEWTKTPIRYASPVRGTWRRNRKPRHELDRGHGHADYALYVDGKLAGAVEAKQAGTTLTGVEVQSEKYATGVPTGYPAHIRPLPFIYESTGVETQFTNRLDPEPRSRRIFTFHRPETLAEWLDLEKSPPPLLPLKGGKPNPRSLLPSTLRLRLRQIPSVLASVGKTDNNCNNVLDGGVVDGVSLGVVYATGGTITFSSLSSSDAVGSFSLTFGTDQLTGSFNVNACSTPLLVAGDGGSITCG